MLLVKTRRACDWAARRFRQPSRSPVGIAVDLLSAPRKRNVPQRPRVRATSRKFVADVPRHRPRTRSSRSLGGRGRASGVKPISVPCLDAAAPPRSSEIAATGDEDDHAREGGERNMRRFQDLLWPPSGRKQMGFTARTRRKKRACARRAAANASALCSSHPISNRPNSFSRG